MILPFHYLLNNLGKVQTFEQLCSETQKVSDTRMALRRSIVERFFTSIPQAFANLSQKKAPLDDKNWDRFDAAFSQIALTCEKKQCALQAVFEIESIAKRRFRTLDAAFVPILMNGPENKQAIASKASLNSEVFQKMLSGNFEESNKRQINLENLTPGCFKIFTAFLQNSPVVIPEDLLKEILDFAYIYSLPGLFSEGAETLFNLLEEQPNKETIRSPKLQENFDYLCSLFGIDNKQVPPQSTSGAAKESSLQAKTIQRAFQLFYAQLAPQNCDTRNRLFEQICRLTLHFWRGTYVKTDEYVARYLLKGPAQNGYARAQRTLGFFFEKADGDKHDYNEARKWYRLASEQGDSRATLGLALCNLEESDDLENALILLLEGLKCAAVQGNGSAQCLYAMLLSDEKNPPDEVKKWLTLAAASGGLLAQFILETALSADAVEADQTNALVKKLSKKRIELVEAAHKTLEKNDEQSLDSMLDLRPEMLSALENGSDCFRTAKYIAITPQGKEFFEHVKNYV